MEQLVHTCMEIGAQTEVDDPVNELAREYGTCCTFSASEVCRGVIIMYDTSFVREFTSMTQQLLMHHF